MSHKIRNFLKKEAVLCISLLLAVLSMIFVPLDRVCELHRLSHIEHITEFNAYNGRAADRAFSTIGGRMLDRQAMCEAFQSYLYCCASSSACS